MSKEPQSGELRYRAALGRSGGLPEVVPSPPKPKRPTQLRVVVEPAKAKPPEPKPPPQPTRRPQSARRSPKRDRALTKWVTTTQQLTADERKMVAGLRLASGGPLAEETRRQIEREVRGR